MTEPDDWVYGVHPVTAVLSRNPNRVRVVYLQRAGRSAGRLQAVHAAAREAGVRVDLVDKRRLDRLVNAPHQGVVAQCHSLALASEADLAACFADLPAPRLMLVLDGVTDPRNLGACLRTAGAAGAHAVLLPKRRSAPLNAVALKTAAGGAEDLLLVEVTNLARALRWLQDQAVWVVGAQAGADTQWDRAHCGGDLAIVLGSEGAGLRALTAKCCDQLVSIPMQGAVQSLNVAVAAGVLLFEAHRQRGSAAASP